VQLNLEKLIEISSDALSTLWPIPIESTAATAAELSSLAQLAELLSLKNGFYAFESALHVFPATKERAVMSLQQWNEPSLWRHAYGGLADGALFFAEDVFGGQFAIDAEGVVSFDPETGKREQLADDVYGWARRVVDDFEFLTGYPLAHEWQAAHGRLKSGNRLLPRVPFVTGGGYNINNLYEIEAGEGLRQRGKLALHIRDLPDGARVTWNL
jgi:hypothetical protein